CQRGFPAKPVQCLREGFGNLLSFNDVKTAAVNQPEGFLTVQGSIHPCEQECLADPHDAGKYVKPAGGEVKPLAEVVVDSHIQAGRIAHMDVQQSLDRARTAVERCLILAKLSEEDGRTTRTFLSPPMREVHRLVRGWMESAGLQVT